MDELENTFFASLLDDYYAECEEHLTRVRSGLLTIESFVDHPVADRTLLEELLRSFHTIKGLSGMVGLAAAETLAHDIESLVRTLLRQCAVLTHPGMDALMAAVRTLEQVIGAHRLRQEIPDTALARASLQALEAYTPPTLPLESIAPGPPMPASPALSAEEQAKLTAAIQEDNDQRRSRGKPPVRKVTLRAATSGDSVLIEVADDGRGIDLPAVAQRARSLRLIDPEAAVDSSNLLEIISHPGFSTRDHADRASGRGIGMTVVTGAVKELGGTLSVATQPQVGTSFTIQLPLTLAILDALIVAVADQVFAVPLAAVREVISITDNEVTLLENNELLSYRDGVLPLIRLCRWFQLHVRAARQHCALVVGEGAKCSGIVVDRILGQREIVVRALADPLVQVRGLAGATELGDGRVVLILDVAAIIQSMRER